MRQRLLLAHVALLMCAGCTSAQTQLPPSANSAAIGAAEATPESLQMRKPPFASNPITSPGKRVPNSSVYLPSRARPGSIVRGQAPIGSQILFLQQDVEIQPDGHFSIAIPATAHGQLDVRVIRPSGQTPITLKINIETP